MNFSSHCAAVIEKAYHVLNLLFRVLPPDQKLLTKAFKIYVRPILKYASTIWSPHLKRDIANTEKVQKYFSRRALGSPDLSYTERLIVLGIDFLEMWRLHVDLILCYKILHGHVDINPDFLHTMLIVGFSFLIVWLTLGIAYLLILLTPLMLIPLNIYCVHVILLSRSLMLYYKNPCHDNMFFLFSDGIMLY